MCPMQSPDISPPSVDGGTGTETDRRQRRDWEARHTVDMSILGQWTKKNNDAELSFITNLLFDT